MKIPKMVMYLMSISCGDGFSFHYVEREIKSDPVTRTNFGSEVNHEMDFFISQLVFTGFSYSPARGFTPA